MTEKIRPVKDPTVAPDGTLVVHTVATPVSFDIRSATTIGSNKVIPVIFVPGIMGTNLRVRSDVKLPKDFPLKAGEAAWHPPNSTSDALLEVRKWSGRSPADRQIILHPDFLEVDDKGELEVESCSLSREVMHERGWGEIYTGCYGTLLHDLQSHLDMTFRKNALGQREIRRHWKMVMDCEPERDWGARNVSKITETELVKFAAYQYPIYAVGYNWLQSCAQSSERLEKRVKEIIKWWKDRRYECDKVILITHSMGGLVARACAKRIPSDIAGVIHGVMPALGAPVAYRRIACGTETSSPSNDKLENFKAEQFAEIAGKHTTHTTPVMAVSPGVLELLPNQNYPRPWFQLRVVLSNNIDSTPLTSGESPYKLYRDTESWYRMINPALADPKGLYRREPGGVIRIIGAALDAAEKFHLELDDFYHGSTFAYYGNDENKRTYGQIRWVAKEVPSSTNVALTKANIQNAKFIGYEEDGARIVEIEGKCRLRFKVEQQDAPGDGTVPRQSGAGPSGSDGVKTVFPTKGYSHQDSFGNRNMILLTRHLIVKIVQDMQ